MTPLLQMTGICVCASFLLAGCQDPKNPTPPKVPQPKAAAAADMPQPMPQMQANRMAKLRSSGDAEQGKRAAAAKQI